MQQYSINTSLRMLINKRLDKANAATKHRGTKYTCTSQSIGIHIPKFIFGKTASSCKTQPLQDLSCEKAVRFVSLSAVTPATWHSSLSR